MLPGSLLYHWKGYKFKKKLHKNEAASLLKLCHNLADHRLSGRGSHCGGEDKEENIHVPLVPLHLSLSFAQSVQWQSWCWIRSCSEQNCVNNRVICKTSENAPKFQVSDPRLLLPPSIFQFMFVPKLFSILKSIKWGQFRLLPIKKKLPYRNYQRMFWRKIHFVTHWPKNLVCGTKMGATKKLRFGKRWILPSVVIGKRQPKGIDLLSFWSIRQQPNNHSGWCNLFLHLGPGSLDKTLHYGASNWN